MNRSQVPHALRRSRDQIAEHWYKAIVLTGTSYLSASALRHRLTELTEQVIEILLADRYEPDEAAAVGAALADLGFYQPETLEQTVQVLASDLAS